MGRVLFLAGFFVILPIGLNAQARSGMAAHGGATASAVAGAASSGRAGSMSAGVGAGSMSSGSMAGARAAGRSFGPSGSHPVYYRAPNGQLMVRRASGPSGLIGGRTGNSNVGRNGSAATSRRRDGFSGFSSDANGVPGLGFDYAHFAATHPNGTRNGERHGRGRNDGAVLFPFFDGGYFLPTGPGVIGDTGEGQPVEEAEDHGDYPSRSSDRPPRTLSVDRVPELGPPAPQADVPEYVFVRRDGTLFFAVAYSWDSGSLRYVSNEGLRRSVSRDALDLDATQQFNEQRGMSFRSPA